MKKFSLLLTASMFVSMISFSQTIKQNIEKLSKDPKTAENAGKADVYILGSKKISNDTAKQVSNTEPTTKTSRKKKQRRKS